MKKHDRSLNSKEQKIPDHPIFMLKLNLIKKLGLKVLEELNSFQINNGLDLSRGINFYEEVRKFEIKIIESALNFTSGNQTAAAKILKINVTTLNSKIKTLNISARPNDVLPLQDSKNRRLN